MKADLSLGRATVVSGGIETHSSFRTEPLARAAESVSVRAVHLSGVKASSATETHLVVANASAIVARSNIGRVALGLSTESAAASKRVEFVASCLRLNCWAAGVIRGGERLHWAEFLGTSAAIAVLRVVATVGFGAVPLTSSGVAESLSVGTVLLSRIVAGVIAESPSDSASDFTIEASKARGVVAAVPADGISANGAFLASNADASARVHA
jgi:hypothetical protein